MTVYNLYAFTPHVYLNLKKIYDLLLELDLGPICIQ